MKIEVLHLNGDEDLWQCDNWEIRGEWLLLQREKAISDTIDLPESSKEFELIAAYKSFVGIRIIPEE